MSADLAVHAAVRARLVATSAVTALVPAAQIIDRNTRPTPDPCVVIGEGQAVDEGGMARNKQRVYLTLHIWKRETGIDGAKAIAGAIRTALHASRIPQTLGYHFADCFVSSSRFLRDPDGDAHGVVTVECVVSEVAS